MRNTTTTARRYLACPENGHDICPPSNCPTNACKNNTHGLVQINHVSASRDHFVRALSRGNSHRSCRARDGNNDRNAAYVVLDFPILLKRTQLRRRGDIECKCTLLRTRVDHVPLLPPPIHTHDSALTTDGFGGGRRNRSTYVRSELDRCVECSP